MYLIFDTSANGQAPKKNAMSMDTSLWPRLVHISWILLDEAYKPIEDYNCLIKPEGFIINSQIEKKAGIDSEKAVKSGDNLSEVLETFSKSVDKAQYVFAHYLYFNGGVVGAECIRKNIKNKLTLAESFCLMHEGTYYCKIRSKMGGYKWPSLNELHTKLFNQKYSPLNNARADVIAASRCFIKMMNIGAFEDIFDE